MRRPALFTNHHLSNKVMNYRKIIGSLALIATLSVCWASMQSTVRAGDLQLGCKSCCPACGYHCELDAEVVDVKKKGFVVECEPICVPRVVWPWQLGKRMFGCLGCCTKDDGCDSCGGGGCTACVHNGARVKMIKVLGTESYECPACEYSWTAEKGGCGCGSPCGGGGCCD